MLFKMNHNDVALPFMVDDYRISNSVSQFSGQHTHGFFYGGCSEGGSRFQWIFALLQVLYEFW